jgi:ClpP class serine protease
LTIDPLLPLSPSLGVTEFDPARILATLERSLFERPVLLMRPDATRTLAPYMLARASAFGEEAGPAYTIEEDVATLTIEGPLYQRAVSMCGFALADGYDAIEARASAAFADSKAGAVLMAIDSPGGDAAGVMELADRLASMSADSGKALIAYASESAASAAYWLASSAVFRWP